MPGHWGAVEWRCWGDGVGGLCGAGCQGAGVVVVGAGCRVFWGAAVQVLGCWGAEALGCGVAGGLGCGGGSVLGCGGIAVLG